MAKKQNSAKIVFWTHIQDESKIIKRMLDSIVDYVDCIVLVDNGSVDGTQDIVREYFSKIDIPSFFYENPDGWTNPGVNRQQAWDYLMSVDHGCDWVLRVDADEVLVVDDDFDWSHFNRDVDSLDTVFKSDDFCIPRTWIWNLRRKWRWKDDEAHEEIVIADVEPEAEGLYSRFLLPFSFRHEARGGGASWQDPTKYVKDVLKLELQTLKRLTEGSNIEHERYYLYYLCRSFNYACLGLDSEWAYKWLPYGKDDVEQFLRKGLYYYDKYIENFVHGPDWVIFYLKSAIHRGLHQNDEVIRCLITSYNANPSRSEAAHDLYQLYKSWNQTGSMVHWAKIIKSIRLDIMKDPWDLEMNKYYDYNENLRQEIDQLLKNDAPVTNISPKNNRLFLKDSKIVIV